MQHSGFLALYSALWVWLLAGGFRFRLSLLVRSPLALALLTAQTEHYDSISALGKTSKPLKLLFSETKYKRGPERGVCAARGQSSSAAGANRATTESTPAAHCTLTCAGELAPSHSAYAPSKESRLRCLSGGLSASERPIFHKDSKGRRVVVNTAMFSVINLSLLFVYALPSKNIYRERSF